MFTELFCLGRSMSEADSWTGDTEHHVDLGVHCAEPEGPDWELYQRVLIAILVSAAGVLAFACTVPRYQAFWLLPPDVPRPPKLLMLKSVGRDDVYAGQ